LTGSQSCATQANGLLQQDRRLAELAEFAQGQSQVVEDIHVIGFQFQGAAEDGHGLGVAFPLLN